MRSWRPSPKCLYVIPEIHGNCRSFETICSRIFPFRKFKDQEDQIIFLGDYIDGFDESDKVIDILISIKQQYPNRSFFIRGNHEDLLLKSLDNSKEHYDRWISSNGHTTIKSYLKKSNINANPLTFPQNRLIDIIPKDHVDFLNSTEFYHKIDNYIFLHGSFDRNKSVEENTHNTLMYDNSYGNYIKQCLSTKNKPEFTDERVYVCAHNNGHDRPFIYSKYFMLGGSAPRDLIIFELNSMECSMIKCNKSKMYKHNFKYYE